MRDHVGGSRAALHRNRPFVAIDLEGMFAIGQVDERVAIVVRHCGSRSVCLKAGDGNERAGPEMWQRHAVARLAVNYNPIRRRVASARPVNENVLFVFRILVCIFRLVELAVHRNDARTVCRRKPQADASTAVGVDVVKRIGRGEVAGQARNGHPLVRLKTGERDGVELVGRRIRRTRRHADAAVARHDTTTVDVECVVVVAHFKRIAAAFNEIGQATTSAGRRHRAPRDAHGIWGEGNR